MLTVLSLLLICTMLLSIFTILPLSASAATDSLVNIFDAATAEEGYYHPTTNEKKSTTASCTNSATVSGGDVITFGPAPKTGLDYHVIAYDASGNIIETDYRNKSVLTVVDSSFMDHYLYSYTVPAGATMIRFRVGQYEKPVFTATKNRPFDAFDFYDYWTEDATREQTLLTAYRGPYCYATGYSGQPITVDENSILKGRSVLFVGDSIVSAERDSNTFLVPTSSPARKGGWGGRIGKANGMDYVINGKSGAPLSSGNNAAEKYGRIVDQLTVAGRSSFDYIIANGGINDAQASMPVGVMTESFDIADFNNATFAGALEEFFYTAKQKYPTALIGYICTFSTPNNHYGKADNMSEYYAIAKQICVKWDVYYLDIYNNTNFCNNVLKTSTTTYLPDYVHPNGAGYDLITPLIERWMKAMPHPDNFEEEPGEPENPGNTETPGEPENPGNTETPGEPENPGNTETPGDTENDDTSNAPISAPDTNGDAEKNDDEKAEDTPPSSGCGAALAPMTTLMLTATAAGTALIGKKKRRKS